MLDRGEDLWEIDWETAMGPCATDCGGVASEDDSDEDSSSDDDDDESAEDDDE
jgi:hypothetical protein